MADLPIETLKFFPIDPVAYPAVVQRRLDERTVELALSVKDFNGVVGDGVNDDRIGIQNCFDAAFGSWTSPHGVTNAGLNRPVYFPPGFYTCSPSHGPYTITGAASDGGLIRLTIGSNSFVDGDVVYVRNITSGTIEANGSWTITHRDATHISLINSVFVNTYVSQAGQTACPPAIRIKSLYGGHIFGAGKGQSTLAAFLPSTAPPVCAAISILGMKNCTVQDMQFASISGIDFDMLDDGAQLTDSSGNQFLNCLGGGSASDNCDHCWYVGGGKKSCYNNLWVNCYLATGKQAGISFNSPEGINNAIFGGNTSIGGNGPNSPNSAAIVVNDGACNTIIGVGFQQLAVLDIDIRKSDNQSYAIHGCRTETFGTHLKTPANPTNLQIHLAALGAPNNNLEYWGTSILHTGGGNITMDAVNAGYNYYCQGNADYVINNCSFNFPGIFTPNLKASAVTLASGGSGYVVGDIIYLGVASGGVHVTVSAVSGGVITAITFTNAGNIPIYWGAPPTNPIPQASGSHPGSGFTGTGATFNVTSWIDSGVVKNFKFLDQFPIPVHTTSVSTYHVLSTDGGTKLQFSAACAVTLDKSSDGTCNLGMGSTIYVQSLASGAGVVTFAGASGVTLKSSGTGGLAKLRTQFSCATLFCDGPDSWTIFGDLT